MTVAFVLTGGASLGAVHVGMLQALYERNIVPDLVVGTSVGAVNGSFIASRPQTVATAVALGEVWRNLRRSDVFPLDFAVGLFGFIGRISHLVPSRALRRLLTRHVEIPLLEDYPLPFHVIATDARTGEEVRISEGDVIDAVLASAAIPGVLPPVQRAGRWLIDGGVSNYAPISHAIDLGADRVYVLTSGSACALTGAPRGAIPMFLHSNSVVITRRLLVEVELLKDRTSLVVLPPPCPLRVPPHDFSRANEMIESSLQTSRNFLDAVERSIEPIPFSDHLLGHIREPAA